MRITRAITLFSLACLLLAAPLAEARTPRPYVKSVSPLRASVGEKMTLQGYYFTPGYAENMVVLVASDGRVSYVRSEHSTKRTMTIIVPKKVERLLNVVNGKPVATSFRVKVIAKRMSRLARGALSQPLIGPDVGGDCDKDGNPNPTDGDDDNDLLPDSIEETARTNPCLPDSDSDRLLDGWEYMSAIDLNRNALPYPGKRPFPNALFADAGVDYDGDGLPAWAEHAMWWAGGHRYPLDYSDGNQTTAPSAPVPYAWNDYSYPFGQLSDDERDFDNDGLANVIEASSFFFEPWSGYPGIVRPDFMDPDTDGDGVLDGEDDQDHDDVSNIEEFRRGIWAMNPCDPGFGRVCPRWIVPGAEPKKPEHLCLSRSLLFGEPGVINFEGDELEGPLSLEEEREGGYCQRPEDRRGL
jgi:hypothetical protein